MNADNDRQKGPRKIAVLGAGHGGLAMAGHLAIMGFETTIWNRSKEKIDCIVDRGGIEVEGVLNGFGKVHCATSEMKEAVEDADIVMVVIPASGHREIAERFAPYLKKDQLVILNPGRTFGAMEFLSVLKEKGKKQHPLVAETQSFVYVSRRVETNKARIIQIKNSVPMAAIPAHRTPDALARIHDAFPQFVAATNVLETSLDNIGAIFHPTLTLLNAARIESTHGDFEYYLEGVTPSTAAVLECGDAERVALGTALGVHCHTAREWLYLAYNSYGKTLYEAIQSTPGYKGVRAPSSLVHRYLFEDVPMSLVPMVSLGHLIGIKTPTMESLVHLASLIDVQDYMTVGRTVEKVGIGGMNVKQIRMVALKGAHR
ncbi:MAG TPA: NAD/NADP octopine/nopaline dehydrogenase family protein [Methanomassiliicoccales archaeon]|jgi:opine dehydrogenase